jgi:hypothetical protein
MYMLACAKLRTPIIEKMRVRPARQHEEQHAVDEPVQQRDEEDFHVEAPSPPVKEGRRARVLARGPLHVAGVG